MSENKREALLRTGEDLFSHNGYRNINIEEITRASGMSTGSFYHYFASKEAFYEAIIALVEERAVRELERLVGGFKSPLNRLKALYRFITLWVPYNPILKGILTDDPKFRFPGLKARGAGPGSLRSHIHATLGVILQEGTRRRIFRARLFHDPQAMLIALFDAVLMKMGRPETSALIDDLLLLIERGLPRIVRLRKPGERADRRLANRRRPARPPTA